MIAKNSDRPENEPQPFVQIPAAQHPRGAVVRCTHVAIDQVAETYRVMGHSPAWCWGFEHGVNENGVAIGNQATWSKESVEEAPGLIGMDLVRLGLERGRDAREALEVIATLVETHGQGGPSFGPEGDAGYQNSFFVADGRSAWVLETTARSWVARSVEGAHLTNRIGLGTDWQIGSRGLARRAVQDGLWREAGRLDFRGAFGLEGWPAYLTAERERSAADVLGGPPITLAALKGWLGDHGEEALPPQGRAEDDARRYSVCMHAAPMATTASLVARLPETIGRRPWPVWISFATPCTSLFLPVYLEGTLPAAFARGPSSDGSPASGPVSMWGVLQALGRATARDFERFLPRLREGWKEVDRWVERERTRVEQEASVALVASRPEEAAALLTGFMDRQVETVVGHAQEWITAFRA